MEVPNGCRGWMRGQPVLAGMIASPTSCWASSRPFSKSEVITTTRSRSGMTWTNWPPKPWARKLWVAVVAGHPPLVAVAVERGGGRRVALALGGGADIAGRDDLDTVPAAAVEVQVAELGEVAGGKLQPGEAAVVALGIGDPGHLGPLVSSLLGWGREGDPDGLEGMLGVDP